MIVNKKLLEKYIKGEASTEERIDIFKWISAHPDHYNRYLLDKRLYELSIYQEENVFQKQKKNGKALLIQLFKYVAVACAIVGAFLFHDILDNETNKNILQTISVPVGQRTSITLKDGTSIELGSNTQLSFPADFKGNSRKVILEGSAYFNVTQNKQKPFIISSKQGSITVTGTSFYVDAIPQYDIFKTSLIEGEVKINLINNPESIITLHPNQQSILKDGKLIVQQIIDYDEFLWRKGFIAFKNKSIEDIFFQLQNYYNIPIVIKNKTLSTSQHTYTGKFYQLDGIDYALRILQEKIKFRYERDDQHQIIYII